MSNAPRSRPTTSERGYGWQHQQRRKRVKRDVERGDATCWRCHHPIHPDEPWDLGHDDHDRTQYRGPEHVKCNRATAGRHRKSPRRWQL